MNALNKNRILWFTILALLTQIEGKVHAQKSESKITELWQEMYVYKDFNENWSGGLLFNNLYSSQFGNYEWFLEGGSSFHAYKWLDIEAIYRQGFYDLNGSKVVEYRPMIRFSGKTQIGNWHIRNRHRVEIRMFENSESRVRYRVDLKLKPKFNWTAFNINPYVLEEIFISHNGFSRNRFYAGIEGNYSWFEPTVYMLLESNSISNDWDNRLIVGFMLGFKL
ncbi:MAG: DUF2490 domain-containing protein [Arenibacter latericius]|nr:DUF2490 domain-containing protein [Arenibacter latericius]